MSTATAQSATGPPDRRRGLTTGEFYRLVERGVLDEGRRVELVDGEMIDKMTKGAPHYNCQNMMTYALIRALPQGWHVGGEGTLELDARNAPEPDLMVLRGVPGRLDPSRFVQVADVGLVVEVAASSLLEDLGDKMRRYATAGVPSYWVMDLAHDLVVAHTQPAGVPPAYQQVARYRRGDDVPLVLDGCEVARLAVADLLPGP